MLLQRLWRKLRPMRADPGRLGMTLRDWLLYHQNEVVFGRCTWMGVPIWKNPLDAWILQEILFAVKPDVVVEIGGAHGGSATFCAHLMDIMGNGTLISVDIDRARWQADHPRIQLITGDSGCADVLARVQTCCQGRRTLVVHDGDHSEPAVLRDLRAYADLVSVGSYFIVEDSIIDQFDPGDGIGGSVGGPMPACAEFLRQDSRFESDRSWERYILTYNPRGYLKRVR